MSNAYKYHFIPWPPTAHCQNENGDGLLKSATYPVGLICFRLAEETEEIDAPKLS